MVVGIANRGDHAQSYHNLLYLGLEKKSMKFKKNYHVQIFSLGYRCIANPMIACNLIEDNKNEKKN